MSLKKLAAGVALTTLASLVATGAYAQSTASQVSEVVVTTNKVQSTDGLAVQTQVAKDQSIVAQAFIKHESPGQNVAQLINMLPGVNYSTEDPTGILSSDLRIHGFDGAHVAFTVDGAPVNDSGNYASYPGEYLPGEFTDRITVNIGGTEVDSPSASATGGTINVVSKTPPSTMGGAVSASGGSYDFYRGYGEFDTGEFGPWGAKAYVGGTYASANKYQGAGNLEQSSIDGRIYQPLRDKDFVSLAFMYNSNRPYFYESSSLAQFAQYGRGIDYNTQWQAPTAVAGAADAVVPASASAPGFEQGSDSNYWKLHPNPVDFGQIRGQSRFDLSHGFTFTFDPWFFYTLANGGGTTSLKESDPRLAGSTAAKACAKGGTGTDLNGDGDCSDTVLFYSPSDTQTDRYGVNSSLLYDLDEHNHLQIAYSLDYANHRQTGLFTTINQQTGDPENVFGGLRGTEVLNADGQALRTRDRFSVAELNQIAFNYIGRFADDKLHVNIGIRDPFFQRRLNQYCYTYNGSTQYCDSVSPTAVQAAYNTGVTAGNTAALSTLLFGSATTISFNPVTKTPNFRMPFSQTYNFNKVLPNAGISYNFDPANQVYASFAQGFSAPKTDDLYTSSQQLVQPETTNNYAVGYRHQTSAITLSASGWYSVWNNHVVQSFDPNDATLSIDRNVGSVTLYGLDLEAGFKPIDHLSIYASATIMKSQLDNNYEVTVSSGPDKGLSVALPVKGKELVLTPDQTLSLRGEYTIGPFVLGLQGKYTGRRFSSDTNDQSIPGFTTVDLDAEYTIPGFGKNTVLELNVANLFNTNYYTRVSTVSNAAAVNLPAASGSGTDVINAASGPFYYIGAPTTIYGTLKVAF